MGFKMISCENNFILGRIPSLFLNEARKAARPMPVKEQSDVIRMRTAGHKARKMIHIQLIVYNLIRKVILNATKKIDRPSHHISFKGSLDAIIRFTAQMQNRSITHEPNGTQS